MTMRTQTRRTRAFRPTTDALEVRNAVSALNLIPELLAQETRPAVETQSTIPGAGEPSGWDSASQPLRVESSATSWTFPTEGSELDFVTQAHDATPDLFSDDPTAPRYDLVHPLIGDLSSVGIWVDSADAGATSVMTFSPALSSPAPSSSGPVQQPIGSGPGGVSSPDPRPLTSATRSAEGTPTTSSGDSDGIRPLSLAPSGGGIGGDAYSAYSYGNPSGGDSGGPSGGTSGGTSSGADLTPSLWLSGGGVGMDDQGDYFSVVGAAVEARVVGASGHLIESVTWAISGAIKEQNYSVPKGETIRLPGTVKHDRVYDTSDSISFYWDETVGNHTVDVTVNYLDGTGSQSVEVDVRKPDVTSFTNDYKELSLGGFSNGVRDFDGFHQGTFTTDPGANFKATVSTTGLPVGGDFGFIQKIDADWEVITVLPKKEGGHTPFLFKRNSGGFVLDNHPESYQLHNFQPQHVDAGSQNVQVPEGPVNAMPIDSPWLGQFVKQNRWESISFKNNYETHFVFRPEGGVWISLSRLTWGNDGYVERDEAGHWQKIDNLPPLPGVPPPLPGKPPNRALPSAPGQAKGDQVTRIVDNWTRYFGQYPTRGPFGVPWDPRPPL